MIPSISTLSSTLHRQQRIPLPELVWDHYTLAAATLSLLIVCILLFVLFSSPASAPHAPTRQNGDSETSPLLNPDGRDERKYQVDDYAHELRKALGTPLDAQSFESRKLYTHILIAGLAVVGLAIDATSIVSTALSSEGEMGSGLYFSASSLALRTLTVVLAMLDLNLAEHTRLTYIALLTFTWLIAQLLVCLTDYKLSLPLLAGDLNLVLHLINIAAGAAGFVLSFTTPTGPTMVVESSEGPTRTVVRDEVGGGSVAQFVMGTLAWPVVKQAYHQSRIEEDDIPALDYTFRSAYIAENIITEYKRALAESEARYPSTATRSNAVKGRALLKALIRCNSAQLKSTMVVLVITTFAFYVPKFGLNILLGGMERYEAELKAGRGGEDGVQRRSRATLVYSAVFYLTLLWESFIVYYYFRPLTVWLKARVQTQLTTLLAWKRLRQKEASAPSNSDDSSPESRTPTAGKEGEDKAEGEGGSASSSSQVINLVTTDVTRIFGRLDMLSFGIMGPLEVFIGGYSAYILLGNGALIGLLVAALMQPIAFLIGRITERIDEKLQKSRDKRVALLSETIRAIRMIKYEAWEDAMAGRIMRTRREELKCQAQSWIIYTFFGGFFAFVPMLTIVVAFYWYTVVEGNTLTASVAFPAVATLIELRFAVSYLPTNFLTAIQAWVSIKRIANYMETGEVELTTEEYRPKTMAGANDIARASSQVGRIALRGAEITWPSDNDASTPPSSSNAPPPAAGNATFTLSIPDATFEVGQTNLVCGKIGSGKTLLLLSLLGEAQLLSGKLECPRSHPAATLFAARTASSSTSSQRRGAGWWIDLSLTAYAPQRPFLFNATVRENILFGLEYNLSRYRAVIFACGLKPDLKIFKDGDRTEIGEGGTNLSGGQKARISLARAIYSHAGTVLIDDCLSALDSHTTKHICEKLFDGGKEGLLDGRTTVLVTHHVRLMAQRCKKVLVLQEGRQAFFGSSEQFTNCVYYQGLESENNAEKEEGATPNFGSQSSTAANSANNSDEEDATEEADEGLLDPAAATKTAGASAFSQRTAIRRQPSTSAFSNVSGVNDGQGEGEEAHKQVTDEKRAQGRVSFAVYSGYIRAGGGILLWVALLGSFSANAFSDLGANWWLRLWAQASSDSAISGDNASNDEHSTEWWIYRWVLIQSLQVVAVTVGYALVCTASLLAGSRLFSQLLRTVLRAPLRFHDSTPSGRLLNRFGKDMEAIDSNIGEELTEAAKSMLVAVASLVATWLGGGSIVIVLLLFMVPIFYVLLTTFTIAGRDLKRLDSNAASKRITCFTDLITGVVTIRSFGSSSAYFATLMEKLDENMMFFFWQGTIRQWQSLLIGLTSSVFVIASTLVVTLTPGFSAARAGFTLSFVQNLTHMLQFGLRSVSNVEQGLVAVERVMEYFEVETEPLDSAPSSAGEEIVPRASWPEKGAIEIRDLHLAYAENLPDVLDGVNLSIQAGERVGIVGATGSGKSTLVSALFRFFEYRSGSIEIDGVDIARVGLKTLRSRMKIVPQDPLILSGTLRSAVDPLEQYADEDIIRVLVRVGLLKEKPSTSSAGYGTFDVASSTPNVVREGGSTSSSTLLSRSSPSPADGEANDDSGTLSSLESRIEESGGNLSSGQKQLLSLSRILLSASSTANANSIVVLDESTSSIDYTTDAKIQSLLDSHFATHNTTVLAIAHRLRSIIGFDTVIVLNRGKVVEKGNPVELLKIEDGWFNRLAKSTGEEEYASLKRSIGMQ